MEKPTTKDRTFLIIAGAVTALFLPFAIAFPPTLAEKAVAVALLVAIACGVATIVIRLKRK